MSTTATPSGAEPVGTLSASGSFSGKVRHIKIVTTEATMICTGDFVKLINGGTVSRAAITTTVPTGYVGIFLGCSYTDPTTGQFTNSAYWPAANAATDAVAFVADDPFLVFRMQASAAVAETSVGLNISGVDTAGSAAIGRSRNVLDGTTEATTNTLPFRILEFVHGGNDKSGDTYPSMDVTILPGKHAYLAILGV